MMVAPVSHPASGRGPFRATCWNSLVVLAAVLAWAWFGRWHGDEGFYLYGGMLALDGRLPYRDFFFSQMPLVLYIYGLAERLPLPAIAAGRLVSALAAWGAAWVALALAYRLSAASNGVEPRRAVRLATLVMVTASYPLFHLAIAKGHAVASLGLTGATYLLVARPDALWAAVAAGALLGTATLVRASVAIALVAAVLWEGIVARRWRSAGVVAAAGALVVAMGLGPFAALDAKNLWFGVWKYHQVSWVRSSRPIATFFERHWPLLGMAVIAAAAAWAGRRRLSPHRPRGIGLPLLLLGTMAVGHLFVGARAPEYHAVELPLAAALIGVGLARGGAALPGVTRVAVTALVLVAGVFNVLTWREGTWLAGYWHPEPSAELRRIVQSAASQGEAVLCMNPDIFLFVNRPGVPGTEMGIFSIMHDYRDGSWRPAGAFTEEDYLRLVEERAVNLVVFREGDVKMMEFASKSRNGRTDFVPRLWVALQRGYRQVVMTAEFEGGARRWPYEVWQRR